ncbi:MAG: PCC domain-containing protein, partial [Candidatus Saccharimonadales bacterium]
MTYNFDGDNYLVRLEKGEKLGECLDKFMSETKIEGGWVNGIGAANEITVGLYQP